VWNFHIYLAATQGEFEGWASFVVMVSSLIFHMAFNVAPEV
jgi:hypothetical protein